MNDDYVFEEGLGEQKIEDYEETHWKNEPVSRLRSFLRIIGKHVVNSMSKEMKISGKSIVRNIAF